MFTVDYFIEKVNSLSEDSFALFEFNDNSGRSCINGHCGLKSTKESTQESIALQKLFSILKLTYKKMPIKTGIYILNPVSFINKIQNQLGILRVSDFDGIYSNKAAMINNGVVKEYQQSTPKQRILAALYDIKKLQQKEEHKVKVVRQYVSVPETITEQSKSLTEVLN